MTPSPWLRLTALAAAAGPFVAVVSGSIGLGAGHRVLAALALPPLAAVTAALPFLDPNKDIPRG